MAEFDYGALSAYLQPSEEDRKRALQSSLMAAGFGILANNNQRGMLGPALGAGGLMGMQNYAQTLQRLPKERGAALTQALQMQKLRKDQAAQDAFSRMYGGGVPSSMTAGAPGAPSGVPGPAAPSGPTLEDIGKLMALDPVRGKAALEMWKTQNPGMQVADGFAYNPRTIEPGFVPQMKVTPQGTAIQVSPNQQGQPEIAIPKGAVEAAGTFADIGEKSKAKFDLIQVPDGRGGTRMMTRESAALMLGANNVPPTATPPQAPPPEGRINLVAKTEKEAEKLVKQYASQGIQVSVKFPGKELTPKAPEPFVPPQVAPAPISGGLPRTEDLLGYTPPKPKAAPEGFEYQPDGSLKAIPGGPKDTSLKDVARVNAARAKADVVAGKVAEALEQTGFLSTGLTGSVMGMVPGTKAFDLDKTIDTLKANLGFSELQAMREASPTGGALGQVAIQELAMLQSTIASLDKGQSEAQLKKNLEAVNTHFNNWKSAVEQSYSGDQQIMIPGEGMSAKPKKLQNVTESEIRETALKYGRSVEQVKKDLGL